METILEVYQTHRLDFAIALIVLALVLLFVLLHRIKKVRQTLNRIVQEVDDYIKFILEDEKKQDVGEIKDLVMLSGSVQDSKARNKRKREEENRLISSVLEEIFP